MDIGIYIADLLKAHEEVSLPGIGTFTRRPRPAVFDSANGVFNAPSSTLILSDKDGDIEVLIEYLSERKNLSHSSSEYFVKRFIDSLLELLQTTGIAEIQALGTIRQREQKIDFEATSWIDSDARFYGLGPVSERKRTEPVAAPPLTADPDPVTRESDFFSEFVRDRDDLTEDQDPADSTDTTAEPGTSKTWYIAAAVLLFVITMAVVFYFVSPSARFYADSLFRSTDPLQGAMVVPGDSVNVDLDSSQTVSAVQDSAATDSIVNRPDSVTIHPSPIPETPITTYEIIGASFGRKADADEYVKKRNEQGLPAKIVENMPGNRIKVSIRTFRDLAAAQNELNNIVRENKDAWIYTNKPKTK